MGLSGVKVTPEIHGVSASGTNCSPFARTLFPSEVRLSSQLLTGAFLAVILLKDCSYLVCV